MKKRAFSRILFSLLLLLFLILFAFLCICAFYHVSYTPEACTESADDLSNPYIGFYSMYGYVLETIHSPIFLTRIPIPKRHSGLVDTLN